MYMKTASFITMLYTGCRMNNKYRIEAEYLTLKDINDINGFVASKRDAELLVLVKNTSNISVSNLERLSPSKNISIRIAGGYTKEKSDRSRNAEYYETKNIYTRDELILIIKKLETIESLIKDNYSDIAKAYYVYKYLCNYLTFSKDEKTSENLLALLTRKTNSIGYSIIFKEMMDRLGIECDLVESIAQNYAWNTITIGDKIYALDLAWDSKLYHDDNNHRIEYFSNQPIDDFLAMHKPAKYERLQDYSKMTLLTDEFLTNLDIVIAEEQASSNVYTFTRNDKTLFLVGIIDEVMVGNKKLYKYLYCDLLENGRKNNPMILFSEIDISHFVKLRNKTEAELKNLVNINDSDNRFLKMKNELSSKLKVINYNIVYFTDYFMNRARLQKLNETKNNYLGYFQTNNDTIETLEDKNMYVINNIRAKKYRREDNSVFVVEKTKQDKNFYYNYYEISNNQNNLKIYKDEIITEEDITNLDDDLDEYVSNVYISKARLNLALRNYAGYLGCLNIKSNKKD